jgi:hypothetical protein
LDSYNIKRILSILEDLKNEKISGIQYIWVDLNNPESSKAVLILHLGGYKNTNIYDFNKGQLFIGTDPEVKNSFFKKIGD